MNDRKSTKLSTDGGAGYPIGSLEHKFAIQLMFEELRKFQDSREYKELKERFKTNPKRSEFLRAAKQLREEIGDRVCKLDAATIDKCRERAISNSRSRMMSLAPGVYRLNDGIMVIGGERPIDDSSQTQDGKTGDG